MTFINNQMQIQLQKKIRKIIISANNKYFWIHGLKRYDLSNQNQIKYGFLERTYNVSNALE